MTLHRVPPALGRTALTPCWPCQPSLSPTPPAANDTPRHRRRFPGATGARSARPGPARGRHHQCRHHRRWLPADHRHATPGGARPGDAPMSRPNAATAPTGACSCRLISTSLPTMSSARGPCAPARLLSTRTCHDPSRRPGGTSGHHPHRPRARPSARYPAPAARRSALRSDLLRKPVVVRQGQSARVVSGRQQLPGRQRRQGPGQCGRRPGGAGAHGLGPDRQRRGPGRRNGAGKP
jgi:hypothetical protein